MGKLQATFVSIVFSAVPFTAHATASFVTTADVVATVSGLGGARRCDVSNRDYSYIYTGDRRGRVPDNGGATIDMTLAENASCQSSARQIVVNFGDVTASTTSPYLPDDLSNSAVVHLVQVIELGTYFLPAGTRISLDVSAAFAGSYSLDPLADYFHEQTAGNSLSVRIYDPRWSFGCYASYESWSRRGFYEETLSPNPDVQHLQLSDDCVVPFDRELTFTMDYWVTSATGNYHRTPEPSPLALLSLAMLAVPAIRRR